MVLRPVIQGGQVRGWERRQGGDFMLVDRESLTYPGILE